jgi:hypothetical protein
LSEYARRPLETACSAECFVALRSQGYGFAPSSGLDSTKHSAPIGRRAYSDRLLERGERSVIVGFGCDLGDDFNVFDRGILTDHDGRAR